MKKPTLPITYRAGAAHDADGKRLDPADFRKAKPKTEDEDE